MVDYTAFLDSTKGILEPGWIKKMAGVIRWFWERIASI